MTSAGSAIRRCWACSCPIGRRQQELSLRAVAALRQRHLQAYAAKNFKDILRLCDVHGVDHLTPVGGTPLMLAARAGNAALVEALLDKGADRMAQDEFGHTAWQHAVNRSIDEPAFAKSALALLFERIAPAGIDVQIEGRLVRVEHHQGEYWVLTLMLAGLKTQWSHCAARPHPAWKYGQGFFAEQLHQALERSAGSSVEGHPAQAQLRQPGAGTRRGRQQLQAGTQAVDAHAQWALPSQPGDAAAPARGLAAGV